MSVLLHDAAVRLHAFESRLTPLIRWLDGMAGRKKFKRVRVLEIEGGWRLIEPDRYSPGRDCLLYRRDPFGVRDIFVERSRRSQPSRSSKETQT